MKRESDLEAGARKGTEEGEAGGGVKVRAVLPHRDSIVIKGHVIYPSSISLVKKYLNKAQERGLVRGPHEYTIGISALLSAGMGKADESKIRVVRPSHIKRGWAETLRFGGGNCPPHECFETSVLRRLDELKGKVPYFEDLLDVMGE
jgi:hypothetical protein